MIVRMAAAGVAVLLLLTGCATTEITSNNVSEESERLEAEGFNLQSCAFVLADENPDLYEQEGTNFFIAAAQVCAQDAIDIGNVDEFNEKYSAGD